MQEEVENRTLTLGINTSKFTGRVLKAALCKYLAHRKEKKLQASRDVKPFGKVSIDDLQKDYGDMRQIDVQDKSLREFDRIARNHGAVSYTHLDVYKRQHAHLCLVLEYGNGLFPAGRVTAGAAVQLVLRLQLVGHSQDFPYLFLRRLGISG